MGLNPPAVPLIQIDQLSKRFGVNAALQDVDLRLEAGSIHALLGQNGAGKSTLIKILSGLYTPTSGRITVAGHLLGTPEAAANMAFIHQDLGLVNSMTIAENIALGTGFGRWVDSFHGASGYVPQIHVATKENTTATDAWDPTGYQDAYRTIWGK